MSRLAVILLVVALALATALVARPSTVDEGEEKASSRDIVLCLDVSGSALPYDREVIDTYRQLVDSFKGETNRPEHLQFDVTYRVSVDRRLRTGVQTA